VAETVTELLRLLEPRNVSGGYECRAGASDSERLFGGQVVGQALSAATRTVDSDRVPNFIHCSSLTAGRAHQPILYRVEQPDFAEGTASLTEKRPPAFAPFSALHF
jgi:acyl-CoA thioesterase-2